MVENRWNIVVSSLQEMYNTNEAIPFDDDVMEKRMNFDSLPEEQLQSYLAKFQEHLENLNRAKALLEKTQDNLSSIIDEQQKAEAAAAEKAEKASGAAHSAKAPSTSNSSSDYSGPLGRQYWLSQYNAPDPIIVGSEVAYKPRKGGDGEWFQCEVIKVSNDGIRFEVRDPEPDELGNTGKVFKCSWKELLLIPTPDAAASRTKTMNYPTGTKVLARYPETTTFYPAEVSGNKRDGTCRLRFDGEEEVDKETEVPRRLVLPFPMASATPASK